MIKKSIRKILRKIFTERTHKWVLFQESPRAQRLRGHWWCACLRGWNADSKCYPYVPLLSYAQLIVWKCLGFSLLQVLTLTLVVVVGGGTAGAFCLSCGFGSQYFESAGSVSLWGYVLFPSAWSLFTRTLHHLHVDPGLVMQWSQWSQWSLCLSGVFQRSATSHCCIEATTTNIRNCLFSSWLLVRNVALSPPVYIGVHVFQQGQYSQEGNEDEHDAWPKNDNVVIHDRGNGA